MVKMVIENYLNLHLGLRVRCVWILFGHTNHFAEVKRKRKKLNIKYGSVGF